MTIAGGAANIWLVVETVRPESGHELQELRDLMTSALPNSGAYGVWVVPRPANRRGPCGPTAWFMTRTGVLEDDAAHMVAITNFLAEHKFNILESEVFVGRDREMIAHFNVELGDDGAPRLRTSLHTFVASNDNRWEWDGRLDVNSDPHPLVDAFRD
jgi:hypothetical protein